MNWKSDRVNEAKPMTAETLMAGFTAMIKQGEKLDRQQFQFWREFYKQPKWYQDKFIQLWGARRIRFEQGLALMSSRIFEELHKPPEDESK